MNTNNYSPEDQLVLDSFDTLFEVRECMRKIEREQNIILEVVETSDASSGRSIAIIHTRDTTPSGHYWEYDINKSHKNQKYANLTPLSKDCAVWIHDNFNVKQQKNGDFVFGEGDICFFWQFLVSQIVHGKYETNHMTTDKLNPIDRLMIALNNIHENVVKSYFDKPRMKAFIERYALLKEKELLNSCIAQPLVIEGVGKPVLKI